MKIIIILCLFIILSTYSYADKLKVGVNHWPPFVYAKDETYRGISVDIVKEIANRLNIKIEIDDYPWSRLLSNLKFGTTDCTAFLAKNKEREQYVLYPSVPYYTITTVFYVQKGKKNLIQKYEDLYKITVGVVTDSEYFDPFNRDSRIDKANVVREIQLLRMLGEGRIDAIVGTHPQVEYDILQNGYSGKFEQAAYRPGNNVHLYIGFSRKSSFSTQIKRINQTILLMKKTGKIQEIADRYLK